MFYVGQKVVCIDDKEGWPNEPGKGDIATISNIYMHLLGILVLELIEFPQPGDSYAAPGWDAISFRPLVERKTDIGVLIALLDPENHKRFENA